MQNKDGVFIAIEGIDGAGKGTQFELLTKRLDLAGFEVVQMDFPRYDEPSSYFVKQYLNGAYGTLHDVGPYTASLFYALDRYEAAKQIRDALKQGKIVLANRFTGSNMAHQGTKFRNADERRGFFIWLDNLEFEMLHIPRPDLNLVLRVPADLAQSQVDKKDKRSYTDKKRDIHEADLDHLHFTAEVYDDMCQLFPRDYVRIDCVRGGNMLPLETISNLVWEKVFPLLPKPTRPRKSVKAETQTTDAVISTDNPYIEQAEEGTRVTEMGENYLADIVTDPSGSIYGFTDTASPAAITAAMATVSQTGGNLRDVLLNKFSHTKAADSKLLRHALTAGGNDAVRQLVGMHLVVEDASSLLIKKLERGRLAGYLEQSTRLSNFDQKDAGGNYKYVVPEYFDEATTAQYRNHLDTIFDAYADMLERLTSYVYENSSNDTDQSADDRQAAAHAKACAILKSVLPVAAKSSVGIFASAQSVESLITRLSGDELPEARTVSQLISAQARISMPALFGPAEKASDNAINYQTATAAGLKKIAAQYLPANHADQTSESVDLIDFWPRNELQLVADMLYEQSNLPLRALQDIISTWPYDKKATVLNSYIGDRKNRHNRPGRALEKAHYAWDIMCDYDTFRALQRHRMVDDLEWQQLTPRYGYDVPELVDAAGLTDSFEQCFDTSLKLYSLLQQSGYAQEAQYATLFGHKMRWKVVYNAREAFHIHELQTAQTADPKVRLLVSRMHEQLAEVHPLIAGGMRLTNTTEG